MAQVLHQSSPDQFYGNYPEHIERRLFLVGPDGTIDDIRYNQYPNTSKSTLINEEHNAQIIDFPNQSAPLAPGSSEVSADKVTNRSSQIEEDPYTNLHRILQEDLNQPAEDINPYSSVSTRKYDYEVAARPDYSKPHNFGPKQQEKFDRFFKDPEELSAEPTNRLTKLGGHIIDISRKVNRAINGASKYEARHAAEKKYITRAKKVGRPLIELQAKRKARINERLESVTEKPVKPRNKVQNQFMMFDKDLESSTNQVAKQFDMFNEDLKLKKMPLSPIHLNEPGKRPDASRFLTSMFPPDTEPGKTEKDRKAS